MVEIDHELRLKILNVFDIHNFTKKQQTDIILQNMIDCKFYVIYPKSKELFEFFKNLCMKEHRYKLSKKHIIILYNNRYYIKFINSFDKKDMDQIEIDF
tara:strand:- start:6797 stop:7093 length:297 start_codon:yes stop_codon:yes gene_type:complete